MILLKRLEERGLNPAGCAFLDLGCGTARDYDIATKAGMKYTGADLSENMLRSARKEHPEGKFFQMDVTNLDFEPETFDIVWACAILLHLMPDDLEKALAEISRVLKQNGVLWVALEKLLEGEKKAEMKVSNKDGVLIERFFERYAAGEFEEVLSKAGFRVICSGEREEGEFGDKTWLWYLAEKR